MNARFSRILVSLLLSCAGTSAYAYDIQILSAVVRDQAIPGATVILQKNGEASIKSTTGSNGKASFNAPFSNTDDSSVTLIVKKDGYSNLVVKCPCGGLAYAISPNMQSLDAIRIVLNWGAEPKDLDAHLVFPGNHVYYSTKHGDDASLDIDQMNGYGPETITLSKRKSGVKYLYAVHNYSDGDKKGSTSLSTVSQSKVFVYVGNSLVRTFTPPKGRVGNTWVVFGIGDEGEFYDINKFNDFADRDQVGSFMNDIIMAGNFASIPEVTTDQKQLADKLNKQGEDAYHAKDYTLAVSLYLEAINNNPEHSQAYSNLGLVFRRMGKTAEALWANRKSIALASGPTKNTVRASSYYNMGKVYEEKGEWHLALDYYVKAKEQKQNPVYDTAISKMKQNLSQ